MSWTLGLELPVIPPPAARLVVRCECGYPAEVFHMAHVGEWTGRCPTCSRMLIVHEVVARARRGDEDV